MNLRQKCKKQKQYIERLERMFPTVEPIYIQSYTEPLNHLRVKRNLWGMPCEDEHFRDLTINEVAHDMSVALGDYVVFDSVEGTATLDVWVKRNDRE